MSITTQQLANIIGFTAQDLAANRYGQLSARQQRRLRRQPVGQIVLWVIVTGGFATLTVFLATAPNASNTAALFIVGAIGLMVSTMGVLSIRDKLRDADTRKVFNITGTADCQRVYEDPGYSYTATINGRRFDITRRTYEALERAPHATYRAYYLPHSGDLLSLEVAG